MPADFDARFSATFRRYEYRVTDAVYGVEPLRRHEILAWRWPLELDRLNAAAAGQTDGYAGWATVYGGDMPEELVEGIDSLQFLFGRDSTTNISAATPPSGAITLQDTALTLGNDANEWRRVGLVQVGILASSPNPAVAGAAAADSRPRALGVVFNPPTAGDTRYRSSYEVTIALRNRLFGN